MFETLMPMARDAVNEHDFKTALGLFASGVTVITTFDEDGSVHGMTATAFCSLSLRPPLVLVAVGRRSRCHRLVRLQKQFGVSILNEGQIDLSRHFGGKPIAGATPPFKTLAGVPVLADAMVSLACLLEAPFEGGDHSIFTGLVTALGATTGRPLVHFAGRYRTLSASGDD